MTKVINKFGAKNGLKIAFSKVFSNNNGFSNAFESPEIYDNVELIISSDCAGNDIIKAWNDKMPEKALLYLGSWNNGFVDNNTTKVINNIKKPKPIEFILYLNDKCKRLEEPSCNPDEFDNIELISKGCYNDTIAAWDDTSPNAVSVYLGSWNDGIIE